MSPMQNFTGVASTAEFRHGPSEIEALTDLLIAARKFAEATDDEAGSLVRSSAAAMAAHYAFPPMIVVSEDG